MPNEATETTAAVADNAASAIAPESVEHGSPHNSAVDTKLDRIIELLESTVAQTTPEAGSGATESASGAGEITEPADGQEIRDASPASLPWTHKRPFRG